VYVELLFLLFAHGSVLVIRACTTEYQGLIYGECLASLIRLNLFT